MSVKGGKREGAGRKPKIDEIKIIEQMDAIAVPKDVWQALWDRCVIGDVQALKLWASYRFGLPKQVVESVNQHTISNFNVKDLIKFDSE
jgi:hypothetical protein